LRPLLRPFAGKRRSCVLLDIEHSSLLFLSFYTQFCGVHLGFF
jgi:hypothetical protein